MNVHSVLYAVVACGRKPTLKTLAGYDAFMSSFSLKTTIRWVKHFSGNKGFVPLRYGGNLGFCSVQGIQSNNVSNLPCLRAFCCGAATGLHKPKWFGVTF